MRSPSKLHLLLAALGVLPLSCAKDASTPADERAPLSKSAPAAPPASAAAPEAVSEEEELSEDMDEVRQQEAKPSRSMPLKDALDRKSGKAEGKKKELSRDQDVDGELANFEAQLASLEGQMRQAGVPVPAPALGSSAAGGEAVDATATAGPLNCEKACELTQAICGLADNICEMKQRHAEDPRYVNACERAQRDCNLGKSTCDGCSR